MLRYLRVMRTLAHSPYWLHCAIAVGVAGLLTFPMVCALLVLLTFGFGLIPLIVVMGIVFLAPVFALAIEKGRANDERRNRIWRTWSLCLIVHAGASAGMCRIWDFMPNAPISSEGRSFAADYLTIFFMPVVFVYKLGSLPLAAKR